MFVRTRTAESLTEINETGEDQEPQAEAEANDVAWARPWPSIRLFVRPYLARIVKQAKARKKQFSP